MTGDPRTSDPAASLREALSSAAAELPDVSEKPTETGADWALRGRVFATVTHGTAEFDLEPVIARAARATPAATPSKRGRDWVAFNPPKVDRYARDRAVAWFGSAYRRAASVR